jgi:hypothetical protein
MMEAGAHKMKLVEKGKAHHGANIFVVRQVMYVNRPKLGSEMKTYQMLILFI